MSRIETYGCVFVSSAPCQPFQYLWKVQEELSYALAQLFRGPARMICVILATDFHSSTLWSLEDRLIFAFMLQATVFLGCPERNQHFLLPSEASFLSRSMVPARFLGLEFFFLFIGFHCVVNTRTCSRRFRNLIFYVSGTHPIRLFRFSGRLFACL